MTTMLDFYREHGISPVKQDIHDLNAHFARRAHLYRSLGLAPKSIEGKSVLEVGPGTGENALYTASLKPSRYVAIEPNPVAAQALAETLPDVEVYCHTLAESPCLVKFDVVICEGLLGLCGDDPRQILEHLTQHVAVGGVLVITCIDAISDHAEVLRRALAQRYVNPDMSLQEKVNALVPVFTPHLATLKGMTRSVEDWILDNILNPASIGPTFSIPDALAHLDGRFEVLGCNPRFLMDWRWYKEAEQGNAWAIESYWRNCHNLLDYRTVDGGLSLTELNQGLLHHCQYVRECVAALERGEHPQVDTSRIENDPSWFGRGQQYLSLVRVT
jgi:SAM-dependent methyltransferase